MEFCEYKRKKKCKKKRRKFIKKRGQVKLEIKSYNRKHSGVETINLVMKKNGLTEAVDFWENYKAAHEWLNKHNSTWWKSRCLALDYENHLLKETVNDLVKIQQFYKNITTVHRSKHRVNEYKTVNFKDEDGYEYEKNIDHSFEFQLNETMMSFLAQSLCHKIELKNKKNRESLNILLEINSGKTDPKAIPFTHKRNEDAKLLYSHATSRILAMETALQTTFENHIAKSKPYYWPNIALKL